MNKKTYYKFILRTSHSKKGVIRKVDRKMLVEVLITKYIGEKMCEITPVTGYNTAVVRRDKIILL